MKTIQTLARIVACLALITAGVLLVLYPSSYLYDVCSTVVRDNVLPVVDKDTARITVGVVVAIVAFLALIPLPGLFARKIRFRDERGETVINLSRIERALGRVLRSLPEVRKLTVSLIPSKDRRTVNVRVSNVVLAKGAGTNTRDLAGALKRVILEQAQLALGPDEVAAINLSVDDVTLPKADANQPSLSRLALDAQRRDASVNRGGYLPEPPGAAATAAAAAASAAAAETVQAETPVAEEAPDAEERSEMEEAPAQDAAPVEEASAAVNADEPEGALLDEIEAAALPPLAQESPLEPPDITPEGLDEEKPLEPLPGAQPETESPSNFDDLVAALGPDRDAAEAPEETEEPRDKLYETPSPALEDDEETEEEDADDSLRRWLDDQGDDNADEEDAANASPSFDYLSDRPTDVEESEAADPLRDDQPDWSPPKSDDDDEDDDDSKA